MYTTEQRNKAKEKIKLLITRATYHGTPLPERETCMALAEKVAAKYGFIIEKKEKAPAKEAPSKKYYNIHVNSYRKNLVEEIMAHLGIRFTEDGHRNIYFWADNFNEEAFTRFYKKFMAAYRKGLKENKEGCYGWDKYDTRYYTDKFLKSFDHGVRNIDNNNKDIFQAWMLGQEFRTIRFK